MDKAIADENMETTTKERNFFWLIGAGMSSNSILTHISPERILLPSFEWLPALVHWLGAAITGVNIKSLVQEFKSQSRSLARPARWTSASTLSIATPRDTSNLLS